jgi:hypothetical protein
MESGKIIGRVTDVFKGSLCVGITLTTTGVLEGGMTIQFEEEASSMGRHASTLNVSSIEIDFKKRDRVIRDDGPCAVWIGGIREDLPPRGCIVTLVNDRKPEDQSAA